SGFLLPFYHSVQNYEFVDFTKMILLQYRDFSDLVEHHQNDGVLGIRILYQGALSVQTIQQAG
ncbi:hypothetical protein, partial [Ferroacidibacillus organovorans]|uniref:hypothetical protein n=1 Tax=Ferroacidibacillus organovorans TaxID=1765683 RepID=UPI001F437C3F